MSENFNLGNIMKQMQGFKSNIDKIKKSLEEKTVEGSAGGGIVKAVVAGNHKVQKIMISDEIFSEDDKEMLEEMVVAAINDGLNRVEEMMKKEMGQLASSMGLPLDGLM
jgi:DNA-binding YbaB/EbfC family protein